MTQTPASTGRQGQPEGTHQAVPRFLDTVAKGVAEEFHRWGDLCRRSFEHREAGRDADADSLFDSARDVAQDHGVSRDLWDDLCKLKSERNGDQHPWFTKDEALQSMDHLPQEYAHLEHVMRRIVAKLKLSSRRCPRH